MLGPNYGEGRRYPGLVKLLTASVAEARRREKRLIVPMKDLMMTRRTMIERTI
jgi:hypothetical protein